MSWYNPLTWFQKDDATGEANSYRLLMQALDDLNAGRISQADYNHLYNVYVQTYGSVPASAAEAANRSQAWMDNLMDGVIADTVTGTVNALKPKNLIPSLWDDVPAWVKWTAAAIAALLALQILTNAGILGKTKATI